MQPFTFAEFQLSAKNAARIAVFEEMPAGKLTPVIIYALLHKTQKTEGVIFEDLYHEDRARYSFICFDPISTFSIKNDHNNNPLAALRERQTPLTFSTRNEVAHLITSAAGFITYDAVRYFEDIPDRHAADSTLPDILFNFYALSLAFDHKRQTILVSIVVETGPQPEKIYHHAREKIAKIISLLTTATAAETTHLSIENGKQAATVKKIETDTSDTDFMQMVEKAKDYIIRGDAFQIVISRCFKRHYSVSPFAIYKTLREVSPAPFMFYFPTESSIIIGASPERLICVHHKEVSINPIAGTRKRTDEKTDAAIAADLLNDTKELAEHMMLVDLARNDVGAVSVPGSVHVSELLNVKHFSHVSHITSTVIGQLQEKYDALDAFSAAFPAGTLSGAPKIRAMQIIDELENSRRGLYGGAMCRIDALGNLDSCIAIRMAVLQNGIATIRTGAGIVYDSNAFTELQETYQKARSILEAIAKAHGE